MELVRAKRPTRLPLVLTRREVDAVLEHMEGPKELMARLLYGSGLRLLECCRLRVKDVDLERRELTVRDGKREKDRITMLPDALVKPMADQIRAARALHQRDLERGAGFVELPYALGKKYPSAVREWGWQWVFPATRCYHHRESGQRRRHFLHESALQRAVRQEVLAPASRSRRAATRFAIMPGAGLCRVRGLEPRSAWGFSLSYPA